MRIRPYSIIAAAAVAILAAPTSTSQASARVEHDLRTAFEALCFEYWSLHIEATGVSPYETAEGRELLADCPNPLD